MIPDAADLRRLDRTIISGFQAIISGKTAGTSSAFSKWWTGRQKSYTFPDGTTHNFWSGNRKHGYIVILPYQMDSDGNITQPVQIYVQDLGNWNACRGDGASWWREIPEELLSD